MPITATTLSIALNDTDGQLVVASATGITAPGINNANRKVLWIDYEQVEVRDVNSTTITVVRGTNGTLPKAHVAGQKVWIGGEGDFAAFTGEGLGLAGASMTRAFETTLPTTAADTATLTMAQLLGGLIVAIPTAVATFTLPTAALLIAALQSFGQPFLGQSFKFVIQNSSAGANTITVAAGVGGTAVTAQTLTIAQAASKQFMIVVTGVDAPTYSLYTFVGPTTF